MTELYDAPINFDDFLLPTPSAMRTPSFSTSLPINNNPSAAAAAASSASSYPPNLFAPTPPTPPPSLPTHTFPPIVDANNAYTDYDPGLVFFPTNQPTPPPPQPSSSLAIPFATHSPATAAAAASFLPPPTLYNTATAYHAPPTTHFSIPTTGSSSASAVAAAAAAASLFGTHTPLSTMQATAAGTAAPAAPATSSSASTIGTPRRRKTSSNTTSPLPLANSPGIDKHKLEERRRKNRLSSSKCYYNRKKQIELVERTLTDEKKRAIQLYETELKLRQENARLKKELVLKNIRIPPSFMTTTRTEAFTRPSVL